MQHDSAWATLSPHRIWWIFILRLWCSIIFWEPPKLFCLRQSQLPSSIFSNFISPQLWDLHTLQPYSCTAQVMYYSLLCTGPTERVHTFLYNGNSNFGTRQKIMFSVLSPRRPKVRQHIMWHLDTPVIVIYKSSNFHCLTHGLKVIVGVEKCKNSIVEWIQIQRTWVEGRHTACRKMRHVS